jgi:hypothetical protein
MSGGFDFESKGFNVPPVPIRYSGDDTGNTEANVAPQPVAITQMLEDHVQRLEDEFRELDAELRQRFGDSSYSVERSEQLLAAIQRLRWAIAKSPVINPLPSMSQEPSAQ